MSRLKKDVEALVTAVTRDLKLRYGHERVLDILTKENKRLREENKRLTLVNAQLLDRLMARNLPEYATAKTDLSEDWTNPFSSDSPYEPLQDEGNIGEVIENAE